MRRTDAISHQICMFSRLRPHFPIVGDFGIFWSCFSTVQVDPVVRVDGKVPETCMGHE